MSPVTPKKPLVISAHELPVRVVFHPPPRGPSVPEVRSYVLRATKSGGLLLNGDDFAQPRAQQRRT